MADAIDRLDNRLQRATVPPRNKSLLSQTPSDPPALREAAALRSKGEELPQPVATMVRLDQPIYARLSEVCFHQKITRETFLEAAFVLAEKDEQLMEQLIAIAKEHCRLRKVAKEERKFQTLLLKRTQQGKAVD